MYCSDCGHLVSTVLLQLLFLHYFDMGIDQKTISILTVTDNLNSQQKELTVTVMRRYSILRIQLGNCYLNAVGYNCSAVI